MSPFEFVSPTRKPESSHHSPHFPYSLATVFVQTAGELDYGNVFEGGPLLYTPMAIFLLGIFVVWVAILISNLLVSIYTKL